MLTLYRPADDCTPSRATRLLREYLLYQNIWETVMPEEYQATQMPITELYPLPEDALVLSRSDGLHVYLSGPLDPDRIGSGIRPLELYQRLVGTGWWDNGEGYALRVAPSGAGSWLPLPQVKSREEQVAAVRESRTDKKRGLERSLIKVDLGDHHDFAALLLDELFVRHWCGEEPYWTLDQMRSVRIPETFLESINEPDQLRVNRLAVFRERLDEYLGLPMEGFDWSDLAMIGSALIWCTLREAEPEHYLQSDLDLMCYSPDYPSYLQIVQRVYHWVRETLRGSDVRLVCMLRVYSQDGGEYPAEAETMLANLHQTLFEVDWEAQVFYRRGWCSETPGWDNGTRLGASVLWRITGLAHPIELHHSLQRPVNAVPFYHVPPVRGYYDGQMPRYMTSALLAYKTGAMVDLRVHQPLEGEKHVIQKTLDRGFHEIEWKYDSLSKYRLDVIYSSLPLHSATLEHWRGYCPEECFRLAIYFAASAISDRDEVLLREIEKLGASSAIWQALLGMLDASGRPLELALPWVVQTLTPSWSYNYNREICAVLEGDHASLTDSRDTTIQSLVETLGRECYRVRMGLSPAVWYPDGPILEEPVEDGDEEEDEEEELDRRSLLTRCSILAANYRLLQLELERASPESPIWSPLALASIYGSASMAVTPQLDLLANATATHQTRIARRVLIIPVTSLDPQLWYDRHKVTKWFIHSIQINAEHVGVVERDGVKYHCFAQRWMMADLPPLTSLWSRAKRAN